MEHEVLLALGTPVLFVLLAKLIISFAGAAKPRLNLPPGPWTLPVIGSIHHLVIGNHGIVHRAMRTLAEKHGALMHIRLGEVAAVVASTPEAAREILKNQDVAFADRHISATIGVFTFDGSDIAFAPYGERWRQLRRLSTQELLSAARVKSFRRIREDEVAWLVQDMAASAAAGATVNLTVRIAKLTNDIVVRCSVGARCMYSDEYLDALRTALSLMSGLTVADLFPSSKLARMVGTAPRKMLVCRKKMEYILGQIVQERKQYMDRRSGGGAGGETAVNECFLDVLLKLQKEGGNAIPITNEIIMVLLYDMFAGGTETSSSTLNWTMAELIRSPRAMAKVQAEVRQAFQGKDTITEEDSNRLSYLKMVIKESLRLHCPVPLLVPRICREKCKVMGYDVPKGTSVFVNMWAICRDPRYWDDAEEFKPERFENSTIDYKGNNFEFLPFGSGRRMCPGINLGLANMEFALASLLYHFDWKLPDEMEAKDVDMWEAPGLLACKHTSLCVCPVTNIAPSRA